MKIFLKNIYFLLFFALGTSSLSAYIVTPPTTILPDINTASPGDGIGAIIAWMIWLVAVLTILSVTWAGVQMLLAVGEEEKMKKARHTMIYSFIGLVVAGLAYGVVQFITNLKLDNFL